MTLRRSLWALALLCLCLGACRSGPKPIPGPKARPMDDALVSAVKDMGPQAITAYVRPNRLTDFDKLISRIVAEAGIALPSGVSPVVALITMGMGGDLSELPSLEGLDHDRPIVFGGLSPSDDALFDAMNYGNIVDISEVPTFLHGRAVLPAKDTNALIGGLVKWAESLDIKLTPFTGDWLKVAPDGVIIGDDPRLMLALIPTPDAVRIEIATGNLDLYPDTKDRLARIALATPDDKLVMTPGMAHFLEGDGASAIHINAQRWVTLGSVFGLMEMSDALSFAAPEFVQHLYAAGSAILLKHSIVTNPGDRQFIDATVSVQAPVDLDVRVTRTLTPRAREAHAAGRQRGGPIFKPRSAEPLAQFHAGFSPRALVETLGPPTMTIPQNNFGIMGGISPAMFFGELIQETGPLTAGYLMLNGPWLAFHILTAGLNTGEDPVTLLPTGFSVVAESLQLPAPGTFGPPTPVGGIILRYSGKMLPLTLVKLQDSLKEAADNAPPDELKLFVESRTVGEDTLVMISVSKPPAEIFDLDNPYESALDYQGGYNFKVLLDQLTPESPIAPEARLLMNLISRGQIVESTDRASQSTRIRISLSNPTTTPPQPLLPILMPTPETLSDTPVSEGEVCLLRATESLQAGFEAVGFAPKLERQALFQRAFEEIEPHLACAEADPTTKDLVPIIRSGHLMFQARLLGGGFTAPAEAIEKAQAACKLGREAGCRLAEDLKPVWDTEKMVSPAAPIPRQLHQYAATEQLVIAQDEVYFGTLRIASTSQLAEGQGPYVPWLIEPFKKLTEGHSTRFHHQRPAILLRMDGGTPYKLVRRVMRTATDHGLQVIVVLKSSKDDTFSAPFNLRDNGVNHGAAGGDDHDMLKGDAPMPPDQGFDTALYLTVSAGGITATHSGQMAGALTRDTAQKGLGVDVVTFAKFIQGLRRETRTKMFKVTVNSEESWETVALMYGLLFVAPGPTFGETPKDVIEFIEYTNPDQLEALEVEFDSPQPMGIGVAPGLGSLGGEPVVTGSMDKGEIRKVISAQRDKVKFCYERELIKDDTLAGKVTVGIMINPSGQVIATNIDTTTLNNSRVESCLEGVIKPMRFPAHNGGGMVKVRYPFDFKSK